MRGEGEGDVAPGSTQDFPRRTEPDARLLQGEKGMKRRR